CATISIFSKYYDDRRNLHSFPTRRSSDLHKTKHRKRKKTNMKTKHSGKIETLRNAIIAAINATGLKGAGEVRSAALKTVRKAFRSEEHTSELQSRENLVCRLLLEKKKKKK